MLVSCIVEVVHCNPYMIHRPKRPPAQIINIISGVKKKVAYLSCVSQSPIFGDLGENPHCIRKLLHRRHIRPSVTSKESFLATLQGDQNQL